MKLTQVLRAGTKFQYFKRYVEREMQKPYIRQFWYPFGGKRVIRREDWYYGENRPWTTEFFYENRMKRHAVLTQQIKDWNIFKGDRVEVLVGKDKGKQGHVNTIIKERNWVYVEGLNCEIDSPFAGGELMRKEKPLLVPTQVKLVDPADEQPTEIEWRYTEEDVFVRVSKRSGRIIPFPAAYYELDDHVIPRYYEVNSKTDTTDKQLKEVTFKPKLCTFEQEIMDSMGIKEDRKPAPTYWY